MHINIIVLHVVTKKLVWVDHCCDRLVSPASPRVKGLAGETSDRLGYLMQGPNYLGNMPSSREFSLGNFYAL